MPPDRSVIDSTEGADLADSVAIADLVEADIAELLPLWRTSFEHGVGIVDPHPLAEQEDYLRRVVLPAHRVRVARLDGRIAGFIAANAESVAQLYVRVDLIGRGIGSRLLRLAQADAEQGLWLYTFARNQGARRFYERHGFVVEAEGFEPFWQLADVKYRWRRPPGAGRAPAWLLAAAALFAGAEDARAQAPRFDPLGHDAIAYGAGSGYPKAVIHRPRFFVGGFSHQDELWEARSVPAAAMPWVLGRAAAEPPLRYAFAGRSGGVDDYLARNPVSGLLIAQGETILVERYQYARHDRHRLAGFSMTKTVVAMLIGHALAEGSIRSLNDTAAAYVSELAGSEYGRSTLRHLLQMSSGVRFDERYSGNDDAERLWLETVVQVGPGGAAALKPFNERSRWPGAIFSYSSAETQVLGLVLARATGRPLADYLADKLWRPMGAEAAASWLIDAAGQEAAYCCLNAVLRDWARLALVLANDGRRGPRADAAQLIPAAWLREATTYAADSPQLDLVWDALQLGYGYQTWLFAQAAGRQRPMFALLGAYGQSIFVDPASRLVMVQTAVFPEAVPDRREALALWRAAVARFGSAP